MEIVVGDYFFQKKHKKVVSTISPFAQVYGKPLTIIEKSCYMIQNIEHAAVQVCAAVPGLDQTKDWLTNFFKGRFTLLSRFLMRHSEPRHWTDKYGIMCQVGLVVSTNCFNLSQATALYLRRHIHIVSPLNSASGVSGFTRCYYYSSVKRKSLGGSSSSKSYRTCQPIRSVPLSGLPNYQP